MAPLLCAMDPRSRTVTEEDQRLLAELSEVLVQLHFFFFYTMLTEDNCSVFSCSHQSNGNCLDVICLLKSSYLPPRSGLGEKKMWKMEWDW